MPYLILFLKGFIIGIGKIIPGVSGSVLAVSMGVYEKSLDYLANFRKKFKESICFLMPLGLGIIMAILLFSKIILFFLNSYPMPTLCLFFGLLIGTIPSVIKKIKFKYQDYLVIILIISVFLLLTSSISLPTFEINSNLSYLWIIMLGMIDALSMIIPGLSGTAIYLMLGSYSFILNLFSNPIENILASSCFIIGFILAFLLLAKLLNYLFKKANHLTWLVIISFILYSLIMFLMEIPFTFNLANILLAIFFILLGFILVLMTPLE